MQRSRLRIVIRWMLLGLVVVETAAGIDALRRRSEDRSVIQRVIAFVGLLFLGALAQADDLPRSSPRREPALRLELLGRVKADQETRTALIDWLKANRLGDDFNPDALSAERKAELEKLGAAVHEADQANTQRLSEIVAKYGWPGTTLVGADGAHAAWLLVQHADADPKLQRKCLDLMAKLPREEVSRTNLAYLTDRVLLAEGKKQVYGTQFTSSGGKWVPRPLEDPGNVDKRRAEVGLEPLAEYVKGLETAYGSPSKK